MGGLGLQVLALRIGGRLEQRSGRPEQGARMRDSHGADQGLVPSTMRASSLTSNSLR